MYITFLNASGPTGDSLYIATEKLDTRYTLRPYDVRYRSRYHRTEEQHIDLEPFSRNTVHSGTDIHCLSVSSDGIICRCGPHGQLGRYLRRVHAYARGTVQMLTRGRWRGGRLVWGRERAVGGQCTVWDRLPLWGR